MIVGIVKEANACTLKFDEAQTHCCTLKFDMAQTRCCILLIK